nr:PaaI family thioesterase [uncultured Cohaesibacter sp.]
MTKSLTGNEDWQAMTIDGFVGLIGPLLRRREEDGSKRYALRVGPAHLNHIGSLHGGVITSLLDQTIALEAWNAAGRKPTVTIQMDTRFLGAAREGELITARAKIRKATRSMIFVDADVTSQEDDLLASATAVMKIMQREAPHG